MYVLKDVDIEVEVDLSINEIFRGLLGSEKEELFDMLLEERSLNNKKYYLESLFLGREDSDILTNKKIWDKIIRLIKYEDSTLKDYIIEELSYEP